MSNMMELLFKTNEDRVVLSTFSGDYTSNMIKEKVRFYMDLLGDKEMNGKKVGILVPSIPSYLSLVLAVNELGGTVIPLSWQFRKEDLNAVLQFLDPHIVFTAKKFNGFDFGSVVHNWAKSLNSETVVYEADANDSWNEMIYPGPTKRLEKDHTDFICCSSGSTGTPKGLVLSANALDFSLKVLSEFTDVQPNDRLFLNAPPTALFGIASLLYGIYSEAKVIFPESFDLGKMVELMAENKANKVFSTPSIFKMIYQVAKQVDPSVVENLELVGLAGEMVSSDYMNQFQNMDECVFIGMYGTTEAGGMAYCNMREEIVFELNRSIDYKIQDGELTVKSPASFIGYYNNPELTKEVFDSDGWLYTGDIVRETGKRKFEIIGRKKEMIKKAGQQVIPGEVEQLLIKHESVKQAVVIGSPHIVFGEQVVAFVVSDDEVDIKELTFFCSQQVAGYKVPDQIILIDSVPISQGKIDKVTLRGILKERSLV